MTRAYRYRPGQREKVVERARQAAIKRNANPAFAAKFATMASRRMKAIHAAARLAAKLPKHEHRIVDEAEMGQGYPRAVRSGGIIYPSVRAAASAAKISVTGMTKRIAAGLAEYV